MCVCTQVLYLDAFALHLNSQIYSYIYYKSAKCACMKTHNCCINACVCVCAWGSAAQLWKAEWIMCVCACVRLCIHVVKRWPHSPSFHSPFVCTLYCTPLLKHTPRQTPAHTQRNTRTRRALTHPERWRQTLPPDTKAIDFTICCNEWSSLANFWI